MACLTVLNGPSKGQRFTLEKPTTRIGRREENDWMLQDGSISGTHCEIVKNGTEFLLRDLDSTNGTKVNNATIKEKVLFRNDILIFGEVPVMIEGDDVPQAEEKPGASGPVPRTTIVIQQKRKLSTPKEFGKKSNSNMIWVSVIVVLVLIIAALLVKMFLPGADAAG